MMLLRDGAVGLSCEHVKQAAKLLPGTMLRGSKIIHCMDWMCKPSVQPSVMSRAIAHGGCTEVISSHFQWISCTDTHQLFYSNAQVIPMSCSNHSNTCIVMPVLSPRASNV